MAHITFKIRSAKQWQDIKSGGKFIGTITETKIFTLDEFCKKLKCSRKTVKKQFTK